MKRIFFIMLLSVIFAYSNAQTSLKKAADFTALSTDGSYHNLYDYLDEGRPVILFFYFSTCPSCQDAVLELNQAFTKYGCDKGGVVFIAVNADKIPEQLSQNQPAFTEVFSEDIAADYMISAFPTTILISPDRNIIKNDIWLGDPVETIFANIGIKPALCDEISLSSNITDLQNEELFVVYPNPANDHIDIDIRTGQTDDFTCIVTDVSGRLVIPVLTIFRNNKYTIDLNEFSPGVYMLNISNNGVNAVKKIVVY